MPSLLRRSTALSAELSPGARGSQYPYTYIHLHTHTHWTHAHTHTHHAFSASEVKGTVGGTVSWCKGAWHSARTEFRAAVPRPVRSARLAPGGARLGPTRSKALPGNSTWHWRLEPPLPAPQSIALSARPARTLAGDCSKEQQPLKNNVLVWLSRSRLFCKGLQCGGDFGG